MSTAEPITLYDSMRLAVQQCSRIDELTEMRDKAAALSAYARQRDDPELDVWMSEIRLRACMRIGEISRDLATNERARTDLHPSDGKQTKTETLAEAGISTTTANRYEQLVGRGEQQADHIVNKAAENYFANSRTNGEAATMEGLQRAVSEAFTEAWGPPPPRPPRKKAPELSSEARQNMKWNSAIMALLETNPELAASGEDPEFSQEESDRAGRAIEILKRYQLKLKELHNVIIKPFG